MKIIAITGNTPHCGKTTTAEYIIKTFSDRCIPYNFSIAEQLKALTHRIYKLDVPFDYFEGSKDKPSAHFRGLTPRQVYISHGEHMKSLHNQNYWCSLLFEQLEQYSATYPDKVAVVSDVGFDSELDYLCKAYGVENVALLRVINNEIKQVNDSRVLVKPVERLWFTADIFNQSIEHGYLQLDKLHEAIHWVVTHTTL